MNAQPISTEKNNQRNHSKFALNQIGEKSKQITERATHLEPNSYLWAAAGSVVASFALQMLGKKHVSNFVGQWAPTLLILGVYSCINKANQA